MANEENQFTKEELIIINPPQPKGDCTGGNCPVDPDEETPENVTTWQNEDDDDETSPDEDNGGESQGGETEKNDSESAENESEEDDPSDINAQIDEIDDIIEKLKATGCSTSSAEDDITEGETEGESEGETEGESEGETEGEGEGETEGEGEGETEGEGEPTGKRCKKPSESKLDEIKDKKLQVEILTKINTLKSGLSNNQLTTKDKATIRKHIENLEDLVV
jgi:hypothetical protein